MANNLSKFYRLGNNFIVYAPAGNNVFEGIGKTKKAAVVDLYSQVSKATKESQEKFQILCKVMNQTSRRLAKLKKKV